MRMTPVLVVCDDVWHPAEVIELGFKPLEGDEFHFTFVKTAKDILTPERIAAYPVVVCAKGNSVNAANQNPWFEEGVTEVMPRDFEAYVKAGGGLLSLHAFNTAKEGDAVCSLVGNYFTGHPPRCGVDVRITDGDHPITRGVGDFHIRDEHYGIVVTAPDAHELMRTRSETGGDMCGAYTREVGGGRLCALTPGHTVDVFYHPQFKKLLRNALKWCAKED